MHRRTRSGYVIEQMLLTMLICAFLIPIITAELGIFSNAFQRSLIIQDEIAIAQIRHILLVSSDITVQGNALQFTYQEKDASLELVNEKLIMHPGTQIFLTQIDNVSFFQNGSTIYMTFNHEDEERTCAIGHAF